MCPLSASFSYCTGQIRSSFSKQMSNFLAEGEQLDDGEDIRTGVQGKASLKFLYAITAGRGPSCFPRHPPPPPAAKRPHTQYNREKAEGVCLCRIGRQPWQRRRGARGDGATTNAKKYDPPSCSEWQGGIILIIRGGVPLHWILGVGTT